MQLHLICHGMMIFWYRKPAGGQPDGYRILIPQAPADKMGMQMHELRLGLGLGAAKSVLGYAPKPQGTQYFTLEFGPAVSGKKRAMKPAAENLTLYSLEGHVARPNYGDDGTAGIAFAIDIPYPEAESIARSESYTDSQGKPRGPYDATGRTVRDFGILAHSIPRSNVFTYNIADAGLPVVLQNQQVASDRREIQAGPLTGDVKVYLYSQPPKPMGKMSHLPEFNKMVAYDSYPELDLSRDPLTAVTCTHLKDVPVPPGLTSDDLKHLTEINGYGDLCDQHLLGVDPAECVQGPGC